MASIKLEGRGGSKKKKKQEEEDDEDVACFMSICCTRVVCMFNWPLHYNRNIIS